MDTSPLPKPSVFREAHLRDYWKVVWQGRWTILAVFVLVAGGTAIWTFMQTPIYSATATVEIQPKARGLVAGQDVSGLGSAGYGWLAEEKYHNTQIEILKSRDVAGRVVHLLDLESHPAFAGAVDPIDAFRGLIRVEPRRETGLLEISIEGPNRDEITRWVNAVAQEYVRRNFEKARGNVDQAIQTIRRQILTLQSDLVQAEKHRIGTLQTTEIFDPQSQEDLLRKNLQKYSDQLSTVRIELNRLTDTLQRIAELQARKGDLLELPELSSDETLKALERDKIDLERQIASFKDSLRAGHPTLKAKQNELEKIQRRIDERVESIVSGLREAGQGLLEQARFLNEEISKADQASLQLAKATSEYGIVKTDAETKNRIFELINKTMNEVQLGAELMNNNVSVLDEATPPFGPIKPRRRVNLAVGSLFGLFLGLGTVFFLEYLDNTIRTPEDVEKYLGVSVLGVIPKMAEQGLTARSVREAYQSLRTSIIFSSKNRQRKVLLITSTGPQEGKSSSVANLGRTLAAAGDRVIIVDCDMRRPTQHIHHGAEREHGLTNFLSALDHEHDWTHYVKPVTPANLHVLTCGPLPPNPPELLGNERFLELLAGLRERYDWVLLDSPPAASLADASLLASISDMIVLVVRHNSTDRDLVIKTLQQLRSVNPTVAGVLLNNVDLERSYHKDYYYAGYYYYTEDEEKGSRKRGGDRKAQVG